MMMKAIVLLLFLSLALNTYLLSYDSMPEDAATRELQDIIDSISDENELLNIQVRQDNESLQSYASQLDYYRNRIFELESQAGICPVGMEGSATLQAPAVFQKIEFVEDGPFIRRLVTEEGEMINISVEIVPGKGRVLVQTMPAMGIILQNAANTAVFVAQEHTGVSLSGSDAIFSVNAEHEIPEVDGPSAGALMTLLMFSAINNEPIDGKVTLTGTIDEHGNIGSIGGVIKKAQASKDSGKELFLIPQENSELVRYVIVERKVGSFTLHERKPEIVDAKSYIEDEIGIEVQYVSSIDDVLEYGLERV
ncbi:S16 family serine protease [Methanolobus sp. ZRKC3]|uniref:S16 family serine protease n=1 Tax=Methanolobus sp. ZRKC3 TaxID=3125786 RepID=UPI003249BC55